MSQEHPTTTRGVVQSEEEAEMANEEGTETPSTDSTETVEQKAAGQPTEETPKDQTGSQPQGTDDQRLPDSHPLVKAYEAQKAEIRTLRSKANVENHEAVAAELKTTQDSLAGLQKRYDRLEAFLVEVGGPLSRALDSRSFTAKLFDTDEAISDLVKAWHRDNPSQVNAALSSDPAAPSEKKPSMNDLLRQAMK